LQSKSSGIGCAESTKITDSSFQDKDMQKTFSKLSAKRTVEFLKLNRSQASLLTGHCHLKNPTVKLVIIDGSICGRCHNGNRNSLTHPLCVTLAELRAPHLGKHFMDMRDYDKIPLCKILYFIIGMGLLAE
jgi:hypothetical protein